MLSLKFPSSTWVGILVLAEELKDIAYVYSWRRNQDPAPWLHSFFIALPFFLDSLTSLISNCLNLPFGTQKRSRRLKSFSYKQEMGNMERICTQEGPTGSCLVSVPALL